MKQNSIASLAIIVVVSLIVIVSLSNSIFLTIDAGERGVLFKRFAGGLDKELVYQPGFHVIAPWNTMYQYNVREQQLEEEMTVLSNNGLNITIDITVRVNPNYTKIGDLHEKFGESYIETLVRAEVRSSARKIFGRFGPEELYSTKRDEVQTMIEDDLEKTLKKNYIDLKAVLIRDIELPDKVKNAIEEKLEAEQASLKYEYLLTQERQEAERKIIEAQAKAESNRILNASLSDNILRDKGIEATIKLAESENSKVIVVGGSDGLPLILGGQ
ncbi:MAG: prohibitin family protein [Saprospiraceae bacterium]